MAHESINPADHSRYYEADALHIPFEIYDKNGDARIDLTGSTIEFYLKEDRTDSDVDAVVNKSSENSGEAEITDAANGEATVYISTDDTDGVLTQNDLRLEEDEFFWVLRVVDQEGNRVTTIEGSWDVHAS